MRIPDEFDYADWLDHQADLGREHAADNFPVCSDECPAGGDHRWTDDVGPEHERLPSELRAHCDECGKTFYRYREGDVIVEAEQVDPIDRLTFPTPTDADADLAMISDEAWLLSQTDWNTR